MLLISYKLVLFVVQENIMTFVFLGNCFTTFIDNKIGHIHATVYILIHKPSLRAAKTVILKAVI